MVFYVYDTILSHVLTQFFNSLFHRTAHTSAQSNVPGFYFYEIKLSVKINIYIF